MASLTAELLILRKRTATWVLLGIWVGLALLFSYLLPYLTAAGASAPTPTSTLPENLVTTLLAGYPFFGGVLALILGVLAAGSDYGWDTLKTLLVQGPARLRILTARLGALAVMLVPFVAGVFACGAVASLVVARAEAATVTWPPAGELAMGLAAGWFVLAVWAALGVLLGIATRGTAMAIGVGIVYALVIEGILSAIATQVTWLTGTVEYFLRANAYSLVTAAGVPTAALGDNGPGSYSGPFVAAPQASAVLAAYLVAFVGVAAWLFHRRDVT